VLDDHSRYNVCLRACGNEQSHTVQAALSNSFRQYGLPEWMIMDNGPPWGDQLESPYTALTVWLMSLGIGVSHSRPYHPQTLGKDERFHRTLKAELLSRELFKNLTCAQQRFNQWRDLYNLQRPHQALDLKPPITRYQPSTRTFPEHPPAFEYAPSDVVRRVQAHGQVCYRGHIYRMSKAFKGQAIALRCAAEDGALDVFFRQHHIGRLDLRTNDFVRV
jgi:hypothetical protein